MSLISVELFGAYSSMCKDLLAKLRLETAPQQQQQQQQRDREDKEVETLLITSDVLDEIWYFCRGWSVHAISIILTILVFPSPFVFSPNRFLRPKHITCATMPWSIWPALVILWGVCWMFHGPWSPLIAGIDCEGPDNQTIYEFAAAPPFDFHNIGNDFDVQPGQLSFDEYELDQLNSATFQANFATISDTGQHSQESSDPVTSDHQQQDGLLSLSLSLSGHHAANGNAVSEGSPQAEQSKTPIRCTEPDCKASSRTFKTERELQRHINSIHEQTTRFACTVAGCNRGPQNPINRLDNFRRHMLRVHSQAGQILAISVPKTTPKGQKRQADTTSHSVSVPEKRYRRIEDAPAHTEVQGSPEPGLDQSAEVARLQRQLRNAAAKIESLERKIETRETFIRKLLTEGPKSAGEYAEDEFLL